MVRVPEEARGDDRRAKMTTRPRRCVALSFACPACDASASPRGAVVAAKHPKSLPGKRCVSSCHPDIKWRRNAAAGAVAGPLDGHRPHWPRCVFPHPVWRPIVRDYRFSCRGSGHRSIHCTRRSNRLLRGQGRYADSALCRCLDDLPRSRSADRRGVHRWSWRRPNHHHSWLLIRHRRLTDYSRLDHRRARKHVHPCSPIHGSEHTACTVVPRTAQCDAGHHRAFHVYFTTHLVPVCKSKMATEINDFI